MSDRATKILTALQALGFPMPAVAAAEILDHHWPADVVQIPTPYEIAMTFGAAAVAAGKSESIAAAMTLAWSAVPEFYKARDWYVNEFAPMRMGLALSPPEGATDEPDAS